MKGWDEMKCCELLENARSLIENPEDWIQGREVSESSQGMCMLGAMRRAFHNPPITGNYPTDDDWRQAIILLRSVMNYKRIVEFNDAPDRTHAEVLAAFDRAIAVLKPREEVFA